MQVSSYSSNFFLSLLENSTDLISIIDGTGCYKFVGGSVKHLLGYDPEEMVGLSAFGFIHEEDQAFTAQALQGALDQKVTLLPHFRFKNKQGQWRWVECTVSNMVDNAEIQGYVTNSRDVTERVEEEQRVKKSKAHFESLFYNHPDAVFELDLKGCFYRINRQVPEITGYGYGEILGAHFSKLVHPDDLPQAQEAFANALEGKSTYHELSIVKKNGSLAFLGITAVPVMLTREVESIQGIAKDITLISKYDAFVKERAEQLNSIMERIPESFFSLNRNWCYTYVNAFHANYLGMEKEEVIGKNILEMFPDLIGSRFYQECLRVIETGAPRYFEEYFPSRKAILNIQILPAGKGIAVHFVDVTKKNREQDRLEKLSLVASKTTTAINILDQEGRIEWVNQAFEQQMGYSLEECYQRYPADFLAGPETLPKTLARIQLKLAKGKSFKGELLNYAKDGRRIWFYLEVTPVFSPEGQLQKFICIRTDITEKKLKEEESLLVTRDLFRQNRDLQRFSYMVSHNLRAPAANVMGLTDILGSVDKYSNLFDETIHKLKISAQDLDQVIRDMNHILSIRENNFSVDKEEVIIAQVCEQALASVQYRLKDCRHQLSLHLDNSITILANRTYLFEIFKNLFSNSIKFRNKDQVLRLEVNMRRQANSIELEVKDNGLGMDLRVVRKDLFQVYKRFHPGYEGRGIGLFLVKSYVQALGGSIQVTSTPGKGACFKIRFKCFAGQQLCTLR